MWRYLNSLLTKSDRIRKTKKVNSDQGVKRKYCRSKPSCNKYAFWQGIQQNRFNIYNTASAHFILIPSSVSSLCIAIVFILSKFLHLFLLFVLLSFSFHLNSFNCIFSYVFASCCRISFYISSVAGRENV